MIERRRKTFCCRCGRVFAENEEYDLMFWEGKMVPVCRDDRTCTPPDTAKMKKVRKIQQRYHLF